MELIPLAIVVVLLYLAWWLEDKWRHGLLGSAFAAILAAVYFYWDGSWVLMSIMVVYAIVCILRWRHERKNKAA